jgi:alpha,alpha-trehalase
MIVYENQSPQSMRQLEIFDVHPLFEDVQLGGVFPDGKTFVDCLPKRSLEEIAREYRRAKTSAGFSLRNFVDAHFERPPEYGTDYVSDPTKEVEEDVESLWTILTRQPDTTAGSLIPLPLPYIVPGGRFREIYYWDSYFTSLGLRASGKVEMIENMVENFSHLIDTVGHIPNGNRTYYLGRSQPPFYALMVKLLGEERGEGTLLKYLPQLEREYQFWMKGAEDLSKNRLTTHHSARMRDGEVLNRYWDENSTPRPESFQEDFDLSHQSNQLPAKLFRHLRAGAESGWDFSSRWFQEGHSLSSIHTTDIAAVDLNCLLLNLERTIVEACQVARNVQETDRFEKIVARREAAIQKYFWNKDQGFYFDYDFAHGQQTSAMTLAGAFPLFFKVATEEQAKAVARTIEKKFLMRGGVVTTLETTGQQWDAPNGWAPLQWITIVGLENYDHRELAAEIASRWIKLNSDVFKRTGKLMEKYNVVDTHLEAGGGEYPGQDGFGWTNGVLLALKARARVEPASSRQ